MIIFGIILKVAFSILKSIESGPRTLPLLNLLKIERTSDFEKGGTTVITEGDVVIYIIRKF